jgi:hypothetical protein
VLIQSEEVWDGVREAYVRERGGRYGTEIQRAMMGMSSTEWSQYLHETAGVPDEPEAINAAVVRRMLAAYHHQLPLIDGAVAAVRRLAAHYPLGLASSSNRPLIETALDAGFAACFSTTVSSERFRTASLLPTSTSKPPGASGSSRASARRSDSHGGIRCESGGNAGDRVSQPVYPRWKDARSGGRHDPLIDDLTPELVDATD